MSARRQSTQRGPRTAALLASLIAGVFVVGLVLQRNAPSPGLQHPVDDGASRTEQRAANAGTRPQAESLDFASADSGRSGQARIDPVRTAEGLLTHGRDLWENGKIEAAARVFEDALTIDSSAETNGAMGALYFRIAGRNKAYEYLRRAAELDPMNPDRWLALANAYQLRGDPGNAWASINKAKKLEPGAPIKRDAAGFAYRADRGPDSIFEHSVYIPRRNHT